MRNPVNSGDIIPNLEEKLWVGLGVHAQDFGDVKAPEGMHSLEFPDRRIEGIQIRSIPGVELQYFVHLQDVGDTLWQTSPVYIGTKGEKRRLEGLAIRVKGEAANQFDVKYYVLIQGVERTPICSNGVYAGTRGESKRVEGIAVWLEYKRPNSDVPKFVTYSKGVVIDGVDSSNIIDRMYKLKCITPSDIYEHLPTLYKYSLECEQIAEFGVRSVVSTWAFLKGLKDNAHPNKKLLCVDLEKSKNIDPAHKAAQENTIRLDFIEGSDLNVDLLDGVDMLFIDTWHVYPQLIRELEQHHRRVRKYIAMHDTEVDGEQGESVRMKMNIPKQSKESGFSEEDIKTGLQRAIREFLQSHREWRIREQFTNNNGLTILERVPENEQQNAEVASMCTGDSCAF